MTTQLIINPTSGAGRSLKRINAHLGLLRAAWPDLEICYSQSAAHVTHLAARAATRGDAQVLVAGADGTVHFAAAGLAHSETALGMLPVGTGNDIARSCGVPSDLEAAIDAMVDGYVGAMDLGVVGGRTFCCVLGVGMDTQALEAINGARVLRRGKVLYTLATLQTLFQYAPQMLRVRSKHVNFSGPVFFAAVTNTATYAGGMQITPDAEVDDGLLDVCVIPKMAPLRMLQAFSGVFSGAHADLDDVICAQDDVIHLESDVPLPITLDGELTDLTTDATVHVERAALRVLGAKTRAASAPIRRAA